MARRLLFPSQVELASLSARVGGLVMASYSFEAADIESAEKTAIQIATGQTLGFIPDNLNEYADFVGRVGSVNYQDGRAIAEIAFPSRLFGQDVAGLMTVLFGKISFYPNLRLEGIRCDQIYLKALQGPKFGLEGLRRLVGKSEAGKPLLMAILKPGIGPSDTVLANQFAQLVDAGTDLVKDDETRIDLSLEDALRRLEQVRSAAKERGIYVTHLTGPAFELKARALKLQQNGAQAFLFCPYTYGLSALQSLCSDAEIKVPIFAHPAFTGPMISGSSAVSAEVALGTILRWAGCDAVLFPSPYGSIALPKRAAIGVHRALTIPEGHLKVTASVPSAGIVPQLVASIREDFGANVVVNAGTGMSKTGGSIAEGAQAFLREIQERF